MQINMMLSPQDLQLILVLHTKKTLTAAAKELAVEQSTLSRRLTTIEEQLGITLFLRHQKGLTSSKAVIDLLPWAEKMDVILRGANQTIGQNNSVEGQVHVTCPEAIADRLLAPRIHQILDKHNNLRLKITGSSQLMDLDKLDCDIAIRMGPKPKADAVILKIADTKICAYAHQKFLPVAGTAKLSDLRILHRLENISPDSKELSSKTTGNLIMSSNRMTTALIAAECGSGTVFLPQKFGKMMPHLVEIPVSDWSYPKVSIYLAAPRTSRKLQHVNIVWDWIKDIFNEIS